MFKDTRGMDPVHVAFSRRGRGWSAELETPGLCCRCGLDGMVTPLRRVVSHRFNDFDRLSQGEGMCRPCAWAYHPSHRTKIWRIRTAGVDLLSANDLAQELSTTGSPTALVVPIGGRKHLLPYAQWQTIRVDDINLNWTSRDVERLKLLTWLRDLGCPARSFRDPTPPWRWISTQPPEHWRAINEHWDALQPWRRNISFLTLALKATATATKTTARTTNPKGRTHEQHSSTHGR